MAETDAVAVEFDVPVVDRRQIAREGCGVGLLLLAVVVGIADAGVGYIEGAA